jgi:beta-hydroxylase
MAKAETEAQDMPTPERPKEISGFRRRFIKKTGKKLVRTIAKFQSKQSLVPDTPHISKEYFDFLDPFVENWETIKAEAEAVLKFKEDIPGFQDISPDQYRLAKGRNWKTFVLFGFGERLEKNTELTPVTASILEKVPNLQIAMLSILSPGYHIPAHTGVTKGILRTHLGLIIPKDYEKCRIRVDDVITPWRPGEIFVFDDTYEHEVWNETDEERVILLFDFDRPMKFWGRFLNKAFLRLMKMTAYYQDPKKNIEDAEARFEAAVQRAEANMESMSD